MPYRITGLGLEVVEVFQATLVGAARMASKMADQGVTEVRVFDDEGREVPEAEWDQAWWDSSRSS